MYLIEDYWQFDWSEDSANDQICDVSESFPEKIQGNTKWAADNNQKCYVCNAYVMSSMKNCMWILRHLFNYIQKDMYDRSVFISSNVDNKVLIVRLLCKSFWMYRQVCRLCTQPKSSAVVGSFVIVFRMLFKNMWD